LDGIRSIGGRLRVPSSVVRGDQGSAREAASFARSLPGVESADVGSTTGNLLIHHDPRLIEAGSLLDVLHAQGFISHPTGGTSRRRIRPATVASLLMRALVAGLVRS
jgi:hypothetical protein